MKLKSTEDYSRFHGVLDLLNTQVRNLDYHPISGEILKPKRREWLVEQRLDWVTRPEHQRFYPWGV